MQPKHRFSVLFVVCLTSLLSLQCHKSSDSSAPKPCKLVSVTASGGGATTVYNITFDDKSRPVTLQVSENLTNSSYTATRTYGDKLIVTSNLFKGSTVPTTVDSVFLDAEGHVASISITGSNGDHSLLTYTRDIHGEITQSTSLFNGTTLNTTTYTYTNSDITSGNDGSGIFTYTYYLDKAASIYDFVAMQQWLTYGIVIMNNRHLCQSIETSHISQTYTYTKNDKGNITDAIVTTTAPSASTGSYHYTYDCN